MAGPEDHNETGAPISPSELHNRALVADLHCDTVLQMRRGYDLFSRHNRYHIDYPRLIEGGVNLQVFAVFLNSKLTGQEAYDRANKNIGIIQSQTAMHADKTEICLTAEHAKRIIDDGKLAVFIGIENGLAIDNSLENLAHFFNQGVRYITLTHTGSHDWCISSGDQSPRFQGLTDFGREVIREMNRLGIIVDVSHISVSAFEEVMKVASRPIIASHSCVYSLCAHDRNLTDAQIEAIAECGGMIGINFCPEFLYEDFKANSHDFPQHKAAFRRMEELFISESPEPDVQAELASLQRSFDEWREEMRPHMPDVGTVVDHIDYIVKLVGADFVGLGSDYDGILLAPNGLEDCSRMPSITAELVHRGYSESDIVKILGGNFMRVFADAGPG
jgi:membrane dipeptidase